MNNDVNELLPHELESVAGGYWLDNPQSEFGKTLNDLGNLGADFGIWLYDITH